MSEVNIPLLRKAVKWAEAEAAKPAGKGRWYQGAWISFDGFSDETDCGTRYCIAGYVAQLVDHRHAVDEMVDGVSSAGRASVALGLVDEPVAKDWSVVAHHPLFDAQNTIEDVRRIAEQIAGESL